MFLICSMLLFHVLYNGTSKVSTSKDGEHRPLKQTRYCTGAEKSDMQTLELSLLRSWDNNSGPPGFPLGCLALLHLGLLVNPQKARSPWGLRIAKEVSSQWQEKPLHLEL